MPRHGTCSFVLLAGLLATACAGSGAGTEPATRPPAPRIGETAPGADPIAEVRRTPPKGSSPLPPVASGATAAAGSGMPAPADVHATLYVIGGRELTTADLGDFVLRYFPDRAREPLGQLVDEALVEHEARLEGVTVDEALVKARAAAYLEERRREVRVQYGAETTLEDLLRTTFGRSLEAFENDAERLARVALVRDRLVRLDQRREERVEVRALTFPEEEPALLAVERLRGGADLTMMAQRLGLRPPAAPPPLGRADIQPAERAEELFAAGAGAVLAPRAFQGPDGRTWWEVIKVVSATPADARPWSALREEVETSIAARAVGVPEYLAWRRRALGRANVDVRRDGRGLVPWIQDSTPDGTPTGIQGASEGSTESGNARGSGQE